MNHGIAIDNPILNSPFTEPSRHWLLDENGVPTGQTAHGRRSEFVVPIPPPRHKVKTPANLDLGDECGQRKPNDDINEIWGKVAAWHSLGEDGLRSAVTPVTARLLRHWRDPERSHRLFFCPTEVAKTAIWLAEVASKAVIDRLRALNADASITGGGGRVHRTACIDVLYQEIAAGRRKLLVEMAGYTAIYHP